MSFLNPNPNVNPCLEWTDVCVVFDRSRRGKNKEGTTIIYRSFKLLLFCYGKDNY